MNRGLLYKTLCGLSLLLLFLSSSNSVYAASHIVTDTVTIGARVESTAVGVGSSGGSVSIPRTAVQFAGEAYPGAPVTLLRGGVYVTHVISNSAGLFTITLEEKYANDTIYSLFAEDVLGERSILINYPLAVQSGFLTFVNGIRFPPTIASDKAEVRKGDFLSLHGYALPQKELKVRITGQADSTFTLTSLSDGPYKIVIPTSGLPKGDYFVSTMYKNDVRSSKLLRFVIGGLNIFNRNGKAVLPGDCNRDDVVNLVDFSVLAYWYGRDNPPSCVDTNLDGLINLTDFSILAFYWTG